MKAHFKRFLIQMLIFNISFGAAFATNCTVSQAAISTSVTLKTGSHNYSVGQFQQNLNVLGFNAGPRDSDFGKQTKAATKRFQKAFGLYEDGVAGIVTITKMNSVASDLQSLLNKAGFGPLATDSILGPVTVSAINRAKKALGFPQNGIADQAFIAKLEKYAAKSSGSGQTSSKATSNAQTSSKTPANGQTAPKASSDVQASSKTTANIQAPAPGLVSAYMTKLTFIPQGVQTCKATSLAMALNLLSGSNAYTTEGLGGAWCYSINKKTYTGADGRSYLASYCLDSYEGSLTDLMKVIDKSVSAGLPVVVPVHNKNGITRKHHWVLLVGKTASDYQIVDPAAKANGAHISDNIMTMAEAGYEFGLTDYATPHYGYISFTAR